MGYEQAHLTHFCYPIRLVVHQHLNSLVVYLGILPENSNHIALESLRTCLVILAQCS